MPKEYILSRQSAHRQLLSRNLLTSLVLHGRLITTESKAKFVKPLADRLLETAKNNQELATKRRVEAILTTKAASQHLYKTVVPTLRATATSHVRLVKTTGRRGDGAGRAALIICTKPPVVEPKATPKKTTKSRSK